MPSKADPKVQKTFLETVLKPLIKKAKNADIELFFLDASHFVMGGFPGRVWSIVRCFVKTSSGRKRYNILDNARYQKCALVFEAAERLGIILQYLPTYSPNLNLIERVWKLVKSRVLNSAYFETFGSFSKNISDCVDPLHISLRNNMDSIVTDNFHIVDEKNVIN